MPSLLNSERSHQLFRAYANFLRSLFPGSWPAITSNKKRLASKNGHLTYFLVKNR